MITKQQIEKEAAAYTNENNGSGFEFQAFVVGAEWAAEQMQAENERLADVIKEVIEQYDAVQVAGLLPDVLIEKAKKALEK